MSGLEQQEFWEFLAIVLAVLAAIGGMLGKLTRLAERILEAWRIRVRRKSIKGLVLSPTVEEVAKYSVKVPQRYDAEELLGIKRARALSRTRFDNVYDRERRRAEGRLYVVGLFMVMFAWVVVVRFILIVFL